MLLRFDFVIDPVRLFNPVVMTLSVLLPLVTPSAADVIESEWRPYEALDAAERRNIAPYCSGGFIATPLQPVAIDQTVFTFDQATAEGNDSGRFTGAVTIRTDAINAEADSVLYQRDETATLQGAVRVWLAEAAFSGDQGQLDLNSQATQLQQAQFVLPSADIHGYAEQLQRSSAQQFSGKGIRFTRCQPVNPAWQLRAGRLQIDNEEQVAKAWHAFVLVRDVPVAYVPYISFAIADQPRSGFLQPTFGSGYLQQYYLHLAPNLDYTLGLNLISSAATTDTSDDGQSFSAFAHNSLRFLTANTEGQTDWVFNIADLATGEWSRGLLEHQQTGRFGALLYATETLWVSDENAYLDLVPGANDLVSNQSSSLSLRGSVAGTELQTTATYTQPVADADEYFQTLTSNFSVQRGAIESSLLLEAATVFAAREPTASDYELRKLPELSLEFSPKPWSNVHSKQLLLATRASRFLPTELVETLSEETSDLATEKQRYVGLAAFSYPLKGRYGALKPLLETLYWQTELTTDSTYPLADTRYNHAAWRLSADYQTEFRLGSARHRLSPRLYYAYAPLLEQQSPIIDSEAADDFELFTASRFSGYDRVGDLNRLSASLGYDFQPQQGDWRWQASAEKGIQLSQERQLLESVDAAASDWQPTYSDWQITTEFSSVNGWALASNAALSHDVGSLKSYAVQGEFRPSDKTFMRFNAERDSDAATLSAGTYYPIRPNIAVIGYGEWSTTTDNPELTDFAATQNLVGVDIDNCCWNIRVAVLQTFAAEDDEGELISLASSTLAPYVEFTLKGIGAGTDTIETMLKRLDFGYEGRLFNYQ